MPYASTKQANMMRAVAHSPTFAKKVGIPQSVGQKFEAHKAKESEMESKKMVGKELAFMKKKGAPKSMVKHEMAEGKAKGKAKAKGYAKGGGCEVKGRGKGRMV